MITSSSGGAEQYPVSVILGTRNRAISLNAALQSLTQQTGDVYFEVIVVDNASTDDTPFVVSRFQECTPPVRYCVETRAGVSHARNTGARHAAGAILAFMDDDQTAAPEWVSVIARAFAANPLVHFLGGRNLPAPGIRLPDWVTPDLAGALALIDRGDSPRPIDRAHWMTLIGGNMACRREVFDAVGGFRPYSRSQDRELTLRLLLAGYAGLYLPGMLMYHHIEAARLTCDHFRRWNEAEGRMRAHYRFLERFDQDGRLLPALPAGRKVWGVSPFVYRQWLTEIGGWLSATARRRRAEAFGHELKARQIYHYIVSAAQGARELVS